MTNKPSNPHCDHCPHWPQAKCHWCQQPPPTYQMEYLPAGTQLHDRHGHPIDAHTYAQLYANPNYRTIGEHTNGPLVVSTAWLGTDQPGRNFETIIYLNNPNNIRARQYYDTYEQAHEGHTTITTALKAGIG